MIRLKSIIFLFFVFAFRLDAQLVEDNKPKTLTESLDIQSITFCKEKDYQFKIENRFYFEGGKVYVCPRNLPLIVTVVDAIAPNLPITYATSWSINGVPNSSITHTVTLNAAAFDTDDMAVLMCVFTNNVGVQITIEVKVKKNVELKWKDGGGVFAFDENEEANYPGFVESPFMPWVFIPTNGVKTLEAKTEPSKGFYAVQNITTSNPALTLNPDMLLEAKQDVILNYNSGVPIIVDVFGCSILNPELKVFTQTPKTFTIKVFRLCESDDDIQEVALGPITPGGIIISPGNDGTIDRLRTFKNWKIGDDLLWTDPLTHLSYIIDGGDGIAQNKILPNSVHCPATYDIIPDMNTLNLMYGTVSVSAISIDIVDLIGNFDLDDDDDVLTESEQKLFHTLRYPVGVVPSNTEVYVVEDLGEKSYMKDGVEYFEATLGRASGLAVNTLALDRKDAVNSTLSHEVGHAKYGLMHPEEQFPPNQPAYKSNFMYGNSETRINKIRVYQFIKINN